MRPGIRTASWIGGILALCAAGAVVTRAVTRARAEANRSARGETRLEILNRTGATVSLYRAAQTLDDARPVNLGPNESWLPAGSYFVEARAGQKLWFYPVSLAGFEKGRVSGETFTITVRSPGTTDPPLPPGCVSGFAFIPAGSFLIGDRKNPLEPHFAWTTSFHFGSFEVTNGEFRRFLVHPAGYADRENWTEAGWAARNPSTLSTARLTPADADYLRFGRDDLPVVLVSWFEANAYGRWLTRTLGKGRWLYRMPTEGEWEKAARGPDGFDYGLGMELSEPQMRLYNWKKNPEVEVTLVGAGETPARYRANRFGVYHASGNAGEWTQGVSRPYGRMAPYRDDDRNRDDAPGLRVTRGGSWYSATVSRLALAYREEFQPELLSNDVGFRVAAFALP
ncbi:MAG TPA: SUMF1/EgtB/PvdO family nonheme iron enzyme [Thermoanaerobaculia bacterium]|nr:SUMF1/EgtB/PvdO family nonheme iron enzyme [Thermoanaerobaculia bacterium]